MKLRPIEGLPAPIQGEGYLLYECVQGSPEWLASRAGVVTASEFKKATTRVNGLTAQQATYVQAILGGQTEAAARAAAGYQKSPTASVVERALAGEPVGDWSDVALDYAFQKAIERISGVPLDENMQTWQMKRGHMLEPEARAAHEDLLAQRGSSLEDMMVMPAGFMTTPDGLFGCSVDGLIGQYGGSEYKCLVAAKRLRKVILNRDISDFLHQIHGCMWISGRRWWHFGLYCPALKPVGLEFQMIEVPRDDAFIEQMQSDLLAFVKIVDDYQQQLIDLGAGAVEAAAAIVRAQMQADLTIEQERAMELEDAF